MLMGNAALRMCGRDLLHMQCDENEQKYQGTAHAAILPAARQR